MYSSSPSSSPITKRSRSDPSDSDNDSRRSSSPHSSPITKRSRSHLSDSDNDNDNDCKVKDSASLSRDSEDEIIVKKKEKIRDEMNHLETIQQNLELKNEIAVLQKVEEKYNHLLTVLGDRVECPICLDVPREGPVYICPNGHLICKSCKGKHCPTCRGVMTQNKSLLAVTVIENIEHKCKFDNCEENMAFDKIEEHKKCCDYRPVRWWPGTCKAGSMTLNDLRCHLSESKTNCHSLQTLKTDEEDGDVGCGTFKVKSNDFFKAKNWKVNIFRLSLQYYEDEDVLFVVQLTRVDGCLRVYLMMLGTKDQCSKYRAQLSIHSADSTPQDADMMLTFVGTPCSIDLCKPEDGNMPSQLIISDESMRTLLSKTNDKMDVFKITLSIRKRN